MIPKPIATAAVGLLKPYCKGLTPEQLQVALTFKPEASGNETLLTRAEAARRLGVSLPTVDRCLADGSLPRRKIRGAVRIPASAIENILQGKEVAR